MRTFTLAAALFLAFGLSAFGQTPAPLKNQDIVELTTAGLSADVIIAKIKASPSEFDTSTQALQELKKAGVSDAVILAMVEALPKPKTEDKPTDSRTPPIMHGEPKASLKFPPRGTYKHKKEIETEYDRFKDVTHVRLKYLNVSTGLADRVSIIAFYSYKGTTPSLPETVGFGFYSFSKEWRFTQNRSFVVIANGERLDFGDAVRVDSKVSSSRYSVTVSEALVVSMPIEPFLKIVSASSLQIRLGYVELPLAPDHYEALKDFASRIDPENK